MVKLSAGLLLHRGPDDATEVLLVHPGGPFWAKKDEGAWSIPKGEYALDDDPHETALREFAEELGAPPPPDERGDDDVDLGFVRLSSGKRIRAFARRADLDASACTSNEFEVEWPPRSGRLQSFPEVDRAEWFPLAEARRKLHPVQAELLDRLAAQRDLR